MSRMLRMNKIIKVRKLKNGKTLKVILKKSSDKNKGKMVFYVKLVYFMKCRVYFRYFMHGIVETMRELFH